MWLIYAERHDRFHSTAADYIKRGDWPPTALDKELAGQDAERTRIGQWRVTALTSILEALSTAVAEVRPVDFTLTDIASTNASTLRVEIEHDQPAATADLAHTTSSLLQFTLHIRGVNYALTNEILTLLANMHDGAQEQAYLPDGNMVVLVTMSHARLTQLTADTNATITDLPAQATDVAAPTVLHYVSKGRLAEGFVHGTALLSLCGQWFVPRVDGSADLPVCETCEQRQPLAQAMLDSLRP